MLLDIFSLEHFQATMARNVSISCSRSPSQGQSGFFQFSKVVQSQNRHTIVIGIKISQTIWIVRMRPFRVKKDKNIIFVIPFGNLQTVFKFLIQNLKIQQPRVEIIDFFFRHHQVGTHHEILL